MARGLALRMDHGSQYLSDHFLNQVRSWGLHPSFGFLEEPETNGVVERWNRTLKEQATYGRVFHSAIPVVARNCTVSVIASRSRMAVRHGMSTRSAARATLSAALA